MLSIGKHSCNYSENYSRRSPTDPSETLTCPLFAGFSTHSSRVPFQWTVGLVLCYLAVFCILVESGFFSIIIQRLLPRSHTGITAKQKNEEDVETELMASHYHQDEILDLVNKNVTRASQLYIQNQSHIAAKDGNSNSEIDHKSAGRKGISTAPKYTNYIKTESSGIIHLNALALKTSKSESILKENKENSKNEDHAQLVLICQEAAYKNISAFPGSVQIQSAAISLLGLVAKYETVRARNLHEADVYGLDIPIKVMRDALKKAKDTDPVDDDDDDDAETEEFIAAELQRKACLYLGALANSSSNEEEGKTSDSHNKNIATKVVEEDGLLAILDAIDWFRYHDGVVNWGLWAIFMLCYDHVGNKIQLVRMDGIARVCTAIKTIVDDNQSQSNQNGNGQALTKRKSSAEEVVRHGVAILYDLLRYDEKSSAVLDFTQIRRMALNAGMHDVVKDAMDSFRSNTEIMMMGQQMLVATGYKGDIPHFDGSIVPTGK
jgi:hypothetical protein